jgi:hypothetical protein
MFSENKEVNHANNPVLIIRIVVVVQHLQDANFHKGLMEICRLILNYFEGNPRVTTPRFIQWFAFQDLPKSPMTKPLDDLICCAIWPHDGVIDSTYVVVLDIVKTMIIHTF